MKLPLLPVCRPGLVVALAVNFCRKLTERERARGRVPAGYEYRLPTEAEWEYACRAGSTGATYEGGNEIKVEADPLALEQIAWYADSSNVPFPSKGMSIENRSGRRYGSGETGPRPVGTKRPNAWGLYDMLGNIDEWCGDWHAAALPGGRVRDPRGPATGSRRTTRGGCWDSTATACRAASRRAVDPWYSYYNIGFRVALAPQLGPP